MTGHASSPTPISSAKWWVRGGIAAVIIIVAMILAQSVFCGSEQQRQTVPEPRATQKETTRPTPAATPTADPGKVTLAHAVPAPLAQVVIAIAKTGNISIRDTSMLNGMTWSGSYTNYPAEKALIEVLNSKGFNVLVVNGESAKITKTMEEKSQESSRQTEKTYQPMVVEDPMARVRRRERERNENRLAFRNAQAVPVVELTGNTPVAVPVEDPMARVQRRAMERLSYQNNYSGYDYRYRYRWWDCSKDPEQDDCKWGELKVNGEGFHVLANLMRAIGGKDGLLEESIIYIGPTTESGDGPMDNYGPASKRNNAFNKPVALKVGRHKVKILHVARNLTLFEDTINIVPRAVARGNPSQLRVDTNHFNNAPFLRQELERDVTKKNKIKEVLNKTSKSS